MQTRVYFPIVAAGLLALSACAPREPDPIRPEPIYNKYGDIVGGCIPSGRNPQSTYEASLPPCDDDCPDGYRSAGANDVCVPIQDGGDPNDPRGQTRGTNQ